MTYHVQHFKLHSVHMFESKDCLC